MVKALRQWLETHQLLAIVTGVAGALVVLSMVLVLGGYLLVTRLSGSDVLCQHLSRPRVGPRQDVDRP